MVAMRVKMGARNGNAARQASTPSTPLNSLPSKTGLLSPNAVKTAPSTHSKSVNADIGRRRQRNIRENLVSVGGMSGGNMVIVSSGLTLLLGAGECTSACTVDFPSAFGFHGFMKADLRMSIKDHRRSKNLKIQLTQVPFAYARQFYVLVSVNTPD